MRTYYTKHTALIFIVASFLLIACKKYPAIDPANSYRPIPQELSQRAMDYLNTLPMPIQYYPERSTFVFQLMSSDTYPQDSAAYRHSTVDSMALDANRAIFYDRTQGEKVGYRFLFMIDFVNGGHREYYYSLAHYMFM